MQGRFVAHEAMVSHNVRDLRDYRGKPYGESMLAVADESRVRPDNSEVERLLCDNTRAREWCGWEPQVSLEEGLRRTSDWVRDHLDRLEAKSYQI